MVEITVDTIDSNLIHQDCCEIGLIRGIGLLGFIRLAGNANDDAVGDDPLNAIPGQDDQHVVAVVHSVGAGGMSLVLVVFAGIGAGVEGDGVGPAGFVVSGQAQLNAVFRAAVRIAAIPNSITLVRMVCLAVDAVDGDLIHQNGREIRKTGDFGIGILPGLLDHKVIGNGPVSFCVRCGDFEHILESEPCALFVKGVRTGIPLYEFPAIRDVDQGSIRSVVLVGQQSDRLVIAGIRIGPRNVRVLTDCVGDVEIHGDGVRNFRFAFTFHVEDTGDHVLCGDPLAAIVLQTDGFCSVLGQCQFMLSAGGVIKVIDVLIRNHIDVTDPGSVHILSRFESVVPPRNEIIILGSVRAVGGTYDLNCIL